jgi:fused signal recognition particle receptor
MKESPGALTRIQKGLQKTSTLIRSGLGGLFRGDRVVVDEQELEHLEQTLIEADLGVETAFQLIEALREKGVFPNREAVRLFLEERMLRQFLDGERALIETPAPAVLVFAGINGAGKTTTIAKLARRLTRSGKRVCLAAADTFRAAAVEQLDVWAERLDVPIVRHRMGSDPAAVAHDACVSARARNLDYVLVDTAGRLHNQRHLMEELKKILRVIRSRVGDESVERILVLDGIAGQNSYAQARHFNESVGVDSAVVTKLDGSARGGIVLAVEKQLSIPVKFVGVGEGMDDLVPFSPHPFVRALLCEGETGGFAASPRDPGTGGAGRS